MAVVSWVMPWGQMAWLRQADDELARNIFDTPSSYVIGGPVPGYQCIPTRVYTSFDAYCQTGGTLAPGALTCHDLEGWDASPAIDKQHPKATIPHFLSLAKARGHGVIESPGRDLVYVQGADDRISQGESTDDAYLRIGIPGACNGAAVLLVQSQNSQKDIPGFTKLLTGAKSQQADPNQALWAGLTTAAGTTVKQLSDAYTAAIGLGVSGFWMTIGAKDQVQTAVDFFRWVSY